MNAYKDGNMHMCIGSQSSYEYMEFSTVSGVVVILTEAMIN